MRRARAAAEAPPATPPTMRMVGVFVDTVDLLIERDGWGFLE
jgi:hypothetical protein